MTWASASETPCRRVLSFYDISYPFRADAFFVQRIPFREGTEIKTVAKKMSRAIVLVFHPSFWHINWIFSFQITPYRFTSRREVKLVSLQLKLFCNLSMSEGCERFMPTNVCVSDQTFMCVCVQLDHVGSKGVYNTLAIAMSRAWKIHFWFIDTIPEELFLRCRQRFSEN